MREKNKFRLYFESLRLERWPRSLAIIPGFIAFLVLQPNNWQINEAVTMGIKLVIAFLLTLFISTANYIINEIADAPYDAHHPGKKNRPLVNNEISKKILMALYFFLVAVSVTVAFFYFKKQGRRIVRGILPPSPKQVGLPGPTRNGKMVLFSAVELKDLFEKGRNYPWQKPDNCPCCNSYSKNC